MPVSDAIKRESSGPTPNHVNPEDGRLTNKDSDTYLDPSVPPAGEAVDIADVSDGEIMDGEEPKELVHMNKVAQIASDALRSK